jgi:hypothetical protein
MSTISGYPARSFAPSQKFLVLDPSTQTTALVLGSDLVSYIAPSLDVVRTNTTLAAALNEDYEVGTFVQTAGGAAIDDGGNGMYLVVAAGDGDYAMLNGNELLLLPFGTLVGSDLDGALVTDDGVQVTIESAIAKREVHFSSLESLRASTCTYDYVTVDAANEGGSTGRMELYNNGTTGTPTTNGNRFSALAAGTFFNAAGIGYSLDLTKGVSDLQFGALYDNSTDDTNAINYALASGAKNVTMGRLGNVAKCNSISVGDGVNVFFADCKLTRNSSANAPLITFTGNSQLLGDLELDGVQGTYTGSSMHGLRVGGGCLSYANILSHDNYKHGIQYNGDVIHMLGYHECYENGTTPGASGTGDGIYAVNSDNSSLKNFYCYDNARNGLTVTTYDGATLDATLSTGFIVDSGRSTSNDYVDIDIEGVTRPRVSNIVDCGGLSASSSVEGNFDKINCTGFYAATHNKIRVRGVYIRPTGTVSNVFLVSGNSPDIDDVYMYDTASSYGTSSTFSVDASTGSGFDANAAVRNVTVEKGYNAIVVSGCQVLVNCAANTGLNRSLQVDSRRIAGTVARQRSVEIRGGVMTAHSTLTGDPSANGFTGTFYQGDRVFRTDAVEAGAASSMYVINGYIYTTGWLQMRTLTGN